MYNDELEKLDTIRKRLDVSYDEAKKALDEADGDVVEALASLEKRQRDIFTMVAELVDEIGKLLDSTPARKVRLKLGRKVVAEIPVALTAAAGFLLGLAAVFVTKAAVELEKEGMEAQTGETSGEE